ncbi:MAG: type IV-A pilus assembly ATPase PilB [Burkholderiales bacterium]|jgi:type IV pilus assembly protein PilB|nr:type IV-A pilus assembly ATPase PilB [Burkholderiales bacterium]
MATPASPLSVSGLARALVQQKVLTQIEMETMASQAKTTGIAFVEQFLMSRKMTATELGLFAAEKFGVPLFDLASIDPNALAKEHFDVKQANAQRILPLHMRGKRLFVAVSDPTNLKALDEIRFKTNLQVEPVLVEDDKLSQVLRYRTEESDTTVKDMTADLANAEADLANLENLGLAVAVSEEANAEVENSPVVRYLQKILLDAIQTGASDIHFEPFEKFFRIRYRLDGVLQEVAQPPMNLREPIATRIKVISRLDISEKRIPQDGRMKLVLTNNKAIDFRVSSLPTLHGEKIVMRILDSSAANLNIDVLGYEPAQKAALLHAVNRPYGMVLVTGPTGSGKTVSLYTCINLLNQPDINISTVEDPAEIQLPGINQVNVNEKAGLTFSTALRSFLRQDPDIVMVGEIRDLETADIAVKAAQTGHLVLSTLHTNDAPTTLTRLANMGIPAFNIASSVILITAQRLGRRLCPQCKQPVNLPKDVLLAAGFKESDLDGSWRPYGPVGCAHCKKTGYKGRVGIYEVMPVSDALREIIMNHGTALDIAAQAQREGINNLRQSGLVKVKAGITSLEEVEAITNE